ncbi:TniQ family protein [Gracilibacillus dipsosauri]|uniref:TniQ domain-containing protein n=1 Tax=Gracilibacillus dipsosauri TaxID=178340 RepID=A0A317L9D9_9BACI|nr:TniQ family protein [Gracilibacillus dipsosauri]PWU70439.1 hypothetical protein DLJ74_00990 [Gracilibacillus dipsosauri]
MIFLPYIYEDELLYSVFARYHHYSGNENPKETMNELYGSHTTCATTLFPTNLNTLLHGFPTPNSFQVKELIIKNTGLPYYTPFIPNERNLELKKLMVEGNGTSFYMKLGRTASTIKNKKYLYCCKSCVNEDTFNN